MEVLLTLSKDVHSVFVKHDIQWNFAGELRVPTTEEIADAIDSISKSLYDKEDWSQVMMGQMVLVKTGLVVDVYVRVGEYNVEAS